MPSNFIPAHVLCLLNRKKYLLLITFTLLNNTQRQYTKQKMMSPGQKSVPLMWQLLTLFNKILIKKIINHFNIKQLQKCNGMTLKKRNKQVHTAWTKNSFTHSFGRLSYCLMDCIQIDIHTNANTFSIYQVLAHGNTRTNVTGEKENNALWINLMYDCLICLVFVFQLLALITVLLCSASTRL